MRDIKFRAWVKFDSGRYAMLDNDNLKEWTLEDLLEDSEEDVVMLYTGINDRNDQPIFEGDIVKYNYIDDGGFSEVIFKHGSFMVDHILMGNMYSQSLEVVGNKYQDPELIK